MAYTPAPLESGTQTLLNRRLAAGKAIITALERQSGLDTLPAQITLPRVLTGIFKLTGFKFEQIGHGRMRDTFAVVSADESLNLVLKLGSKQATARDIALTLAYPEDRAALFAASEYGVVAERVSPFTRKFLARDEFDELILSRFGKRYVGIAPEDLGMIGDRIVMIGSSTRVIKQDAAVKGSASQQTRTV
jgi:hypothetical protein